MLLLNKENIKAAAIAIFLLVTVPIFSLQLGDGTDKDTYTPIKVMEDVKQVYITDYYNTFIIKNDNSLWATGYNKNDLLGVGIKDDIHTFMKVMDNVKSVSNYTILKTDGTLWAMRMNEGLIDKIDDNVVKVSAGYGIMYIKADNTLWGYGENYKGSFGTGLRGETYPVPKKLRDNVIDVYNESIYSLIITTDNELFISGVHYLPKPYTSPFYSFIKFADNVRAVSNGFYITKDNSLYAFGYSAQGALGVGDITENILPTLIMKDVKSVSSTQSCTFILKMDGSLYGCGGRTPNYFGSLGTGDTKPVLHPILLQKKVKEISVGDSHTAFIKEDGSLWVCGANSYPPLM